MSLNINCIARQRLSNDVAPLIIQSAVAPPVIAVRISVAWATGYGWSRFFRLQTRNRRWSSALKKALAHILTEGSKHRMEEAVVGKYGRTLDDLNGAQPLEAVRNSFAQLFKAVFDGSHVRTLGP